MTDTRDAPLQSLAVLVTRPQHQAQRLCELIATAGGVAHAVPMLEILPAEEPAQVLATIGDPAQYDLLVFVSSNAVRHALDYLPEGPSTLAQIAAVGPSTARALRDAGLRCDVVPASGYASEDLLDEPAMRKVRGRHALIFRGNGGRPLLGDTLAERGAQVTYANVYRRAVPAASAAQLHKLLENKAVQVATATSVETLDNLLEMAGPEHAAAVRELTLLTASSRVVERATSAGFTAAPVLASGPDDQSMLDALLAWHDGAPEATGQTAAQARPDASTPPTPESADKASARHGGDAEPDAPATAAARPDAQNNASAGPDSSAATPDLAAGQHDPSGTGKRRRRRKRRGKGTGGPQQAGDGAGPEASKAAAQQNDQPAAAMSHQNGDSIASDTHLGSASAADIEPQETQPMTTSASADTAQPAPAKSARGGTLLAAVALLLALLACAAAGFNWYTANQSRAALAVLTGNLPDGEAIAADARRQIERSGDALRRDIDARLAIIEKIDLSAVDSLSAEQTRQGNMQREQTRSVATLNERLGRMEQDLNAMQGVSISVRDTWVRAEAEYFLQTANSRLQLAHDVDSALQALRAADARIGVLGDPALTPIRSLVAEEILAVEAIPRPDVQGIALALNGLAERVPSLPIDALAPEAYSVDAPVDSSASGWQRFKDSVVGVMGNIVRVSPADGSSGKAVMAPEQSWFLYRNLELQLHAARLALLDRDPENFRGSIDTALRWLDDHFIGDDPAVASATARLAELRDTDIDPPMPDISRSLRRLREVVAATGSSTP